MIYSSKYQSSQSYAVHVALTHTLVAARELFRRSKTADIRKSSAPPPPPPPPPPFRAFTCNALVLALVKVRKTRGSCSCTVAMTGIDAT
ncbi:unnamed protein product [Chondrus crispus]|uniref:Uncharacterized protein n=1 Tax=Chondrus crispus TaxID=2769 RepID=R7QPM6_CHOCR|nr:unnamed protein product [Chondrus crispus]CDF40437.1 unnamed protein product [Chondrus crispus]|eukprot:XP_005710731.1 unnamed protein product [Chondrus crispus]